MAIRRVTIDLDDSADNNKHTLVAQSLTGRKVPTRKYEGTSLPVHEEEAQETELTEKTLPSPTIGRTYSDLIYEFYNSPRAMATILMFAPMPFFAFNINNINGLIYPIILGVVLNVVWFGVPALMCLFKLFRKKM